MPGRRHDLPCRPAAEATPAPYPPARGLFAIHAFTFPVTGGTTFPTDYLTPDLGLALVNLHLHGSADVAAVRDLHAIGLIAPARFSGPDPQGRRLAFEAVALEFQAHLEIGDILQGRAIRHRFVQEAFTRMATDQFAAAEELVFEHQHLARLSPEALASAHRRSAKDWRAAATSKESPP